MSVLGAAELRAALAAQYEILEQLGQGAYGTVFRGTQKSTGQAVAIKAQRLEPGDRGPGRLARFEREIRLCATLNHPNIVRLIDGGRFDGGLYMAFELVPGETLTELLARRGALPAGETAALLAEVLDGLGAAHAQGIVHRDLKPDNIMVVSAGPAPYVKVLDFGIGAYVVESIPALPTLTRSQEILGTPSYSAPEQLRGEPATPRSDLYAWGLVMLECLTGRRVMDGATAAQIFHEQLSASQIALPPTIAMHPLGDLLRRVLAKVPRERAADAGRLAQELRALRLADLVGAALGPSTVRPERTAALEAAPWPGEQRQATILSCSLNVLASGPVDLEALDAIERGQLNACLDITGRFGGHLVGRMGGRLMVAFGFPRASDGDARRACRAALEIGVRISARRALLTSQRGVDLELRIGIHTGGVLVDSDGAPSGPALALAARLEGLAPAGAVLVSETTRNLLARQLGFQPHSRVGRLEVHALVSEGASASDGAGSSELVGREREMETLLGHLGESRLGSGAVVVLRGEPGMGKSRLVREVRERALDRGASCYACHCLPEESHSALRPVLGFLQQLLAGDDGTAGLEAMLLQCGLDPAATLPVLCAWLALPLPAGYAVSPQTPERQREQLLQALARLFTTVRSGEHRLIVIEDLHWSDATTRQFVERVAALAAGVPVLVLLTARPELAWAPDRAHHLHLGGLEGPAVERLAVASAGAQPLDAALLASIVARADGIPLFVEELTRSLLGAADGSGAIPATLRDLLASRLDALGPAKETAQVAAAIGRDFELGLLDEASGRGRDALQVHLEALVEADLVRHQGMANGAHYQFRHALIREAAWQSMPASQRRSVHGRIAAALERRSGAGREVESARLAWHHELAGDAHRAVHHRLLAGEHAARACAHDEAEAHLRAGLALLPGVPDEKRRAALEIDLVQTLGAILIPGHGMAGDAVVEAYSRGWELVRAGNASPAQSARMLRGLWTFRNARAEYAAAAEMTTRLVELATREGDRELLLSAHQCAGQTALLLGRFGDCVRHARECTRHNDPGRQRERVVRYATDPWLNALSFECIALTLLGRLQKARDQIELVRARAEVLGIAGLEATMLGQAAWLDLLLGDCLAGPDQWRARAAGRAGRALRLAEEAGNRFGQAYATLILAAAEAGNGAGVAALEQTVQLWRRSGTQALLSWVLAFLAQGRLARGDRAGALAAARESIEHCARTGEAYGLAEAQRSAGLALGGTDEGRRAFEVALDVARQQEARWLGLRAAFSFAGTFPGDPDARGHVERELRWFEEEGEGEDTPLVRRSRALLAS